MRVLIIHNEATYLAGAEKMLGYFLEGMLESGAEAHVAIVPGTRTEELIPPGIPRTSLHNNERFTLGGLLRQTRQLAAYERRIGFDLFHGWAARDWESTSVLARLRRRPAVGTLHDHPEAPFISRARRRLMRWEAQWGLRGVACVSGAVRQACRAAGYPASKLAVIHNGLPGLTASLLPEPAPDPAVCRLGFLGIFSERKGLRGLFEMADRLAGLTDCPWELELAGGAHDASGESLMTAVRRKYESAPWWGRVSWVGWVKQPHEFLRGIDLLICPSTEFDPFPTVLLEAGRAGVPVLTSWAGGAPEIVEDGVTGWLIAPDDWAGGARCLARLIAEPPVRRAAGAAARARIAEQFSVGKMVANYLELYSSVLTDAA